MHKVDLGTMFFNGEITMSKAVLGIDVGKKKLDVVLIFNQKTLPRKFDNSPNGFKLMAGWLASLRISEVHACLEATGIYGEPVAEFLYEKGHHVSVVNPLRIKGYAKSDLQRNKTDPADARTIADFCLVKNPDLWHPPSTEVKHLQELTRRLESLTDMLGAENNRLESSSRQIRPSLKRIIRTLEKEIENVRRLIKEHIDHHPDLKNQSDLLQTIPGIGQTTAQVLLSEIEFARFDSARSVAAQAGVTPGRRQSGNSLNWTKLSKIGNGRIRKALYFPAISAMKHNEVIKTFASRLSQNGKAPMQVICAAMRKLLHIAFGVLKYKNPFDPNLAFSI
jgi:transposase